MNRPHVVILGAGPAGSTAALALLPDYQVSLVDPCEPGKRPFRVGETLPAAGKRILLELGLWEAFSKQDHLPVTQRRTYWGSSVQQTQDSFLNLDGPDYLLDRPQFENFLCQEAIHRGATPITAKLTDCKKQLTHWQIGLSNQETLLADWVIDATGRRASFAVRAGEERRHLDRLVAHWSLSPSLPSQPPGITTMSTENGWWYQASLPSSHQLIIFFTDADQAQPTRSPLTENWSLSSPKKTAAHSAILSASIGHRWHAIGDASLAFDPLSSQGLFHALYTGLRSREVIQKQDDKFYQKEIVQIFSAYQDHYSFYYNAEQRWSDASFWQRRHQSPLTYEKTTTIQKTGHSHSGKQPSSLQPTYR